MKQSTRNKKSAITVTATPETAREGMLRLARERIARLEALPLDPDDVKGWTIATAEAFRAIEHPSPPARAINANGIPVLSDEQEAAETAALRARRGAAIGPHLGNARAMTLTELLCLGLGMDEDPERFAASALEVIADRLNVLWIAADAAEGLDRLEIVNGIVDIMRQAQAAAQIAERIERAA